MYSIVPFTWARGGTFPPPPHVLIIELNIQKVKSFVVVKKKAGQLSFLYIYFDLNPVKILNQMENKLYTKIRFV